MRIEWLPISASALVTGVMALVLGALLNPSVQEQDPAATLEVVSQHGGRWLGMAVLFFLASVALTLGLPAMLTLFTGRGRVLGLLGAGIFSVGAIGTSGYAMLMVFFRALVMNDAVRSAPLDAVVGDAGLRIFLYTWVGCFYGGLFVIALALFRARKTALWVPALLLVYLATTPLANQAGRVGMTVQLLLLAIAFTGVATAANAPGQRSVLGQEAAAV